MSKPRPADPAQLAGRPPVRKTWLFFVTALIALSADLVSKIVVVATIDPGDPGVRLLGGALYLVHARNSGAAFSLAAGATAVLTAISVVVIAVVIRAARKLTSSRWALALGLVLGGAMGNLVDRLFRAPSPGKGHVVDWISVLANDGHVWPIFNLADSAIMTGGALAVLLSLRGVEFGSDRSRRPEDQRPEDQRPEDQRPEDRRPEDRRPEDEPAELPQSRLVDDPPADAPVATPQDRAPEGSPRD